MDNISLRTHQNTGFENIINSITQKTLLKMFCGSGKTRIAFKTIVYYQKNLSVIVFPNIGLIDQFNMDYLLNPQWVNTLSVFAKLSVCSKKEFHAENHIPYATQPLAIREFLKNQSQPKIICITYQSFPTLFDIGPQIDYIIFDEAHHVIGDKIQQLIFHPSFQPLQVMFMTATPKNQNGIIMVDEGENQSMCGPIVYSYTHFQGVSDGILNGFQIMVDLFLEPTASSTSSSSSTTLESICRAVLQTGNNRVLTFHSRTETEHSTRTNVLEFVDEKRIKAAFQKVLTEEFPLLKKKYHRIHFKGITANTKNKRHLLEQFDQCPDDEIFVLASCKTINEGIDTKNANMCVFVDPKNSHSDIIQNIGRITRLPRPDIPFATILIPVGVDASKYSSLQTQEERDAVIREDMNQGGNFSSILNVIAALKHDDEELYEMCLNYPHSYSPEEMEENFLEQGYEIKREDEEDEGLDLGQVLEDMLEEDLSDYDLSESDSDSDSDSESNSGTESSEGRSRDQVLQTIAEDHDATIRIHTHCMDNPIQVFGDNPDRVLNIYENEQGGYHALNPQQNDRTVSILKAPRRQKLMSVHTNSDIQLLWNIVGDMDLTKEVCSVVLDCEVVKEDPMERAREIVERALYREMNGGRLLPRIIDKGKRTTEEFVQENKDANKLSTYKKSIKGMKGGCKCNDDVRNYLDSNLLGWRDEASFDERAMQDARKIVERANQREKVGKNLLPIKKHNQITTENEQEAKDLNKLRSWKSALKGSQNSRCCDNLREYLDSNLQGWRFEVNFEAKALQHAQEITKRAFQRKIDGGRLLPRKIHDKNNRSTKELEQENIDANKLSGWKRALKNKGHQQCYGVVCKYLDNNLPFWKDEVDFDEKALQDAKDIFNRALYRQLHGGRLLPLFIEKQNRTTKVFEQEQQDAVKLGRWKQALKGNSTDTRCSDEVCCFLDKNLHGWRETNKEKSLTKAKEIVQRALKRQEAGGRLLPKKMHVKVLTYELLQEKRDALRLCSWRNRVSLRGDINEVYSFLDRNLSNWRLDVDFETRDMQTAQDIVKRALQRQQDGGKLLPRNMHRNNLPEKLKLEKQDAIKLVHWKQILKGNKNSKCSDEVINYLDQNLPKWREDFNEKSLIVSHGIVQRALQRQLNGGRLLPRQLTDTSKRTTAELIQESKDAAKLNNLNKALKGRGGQCSNQVKSYLDHNLPGWCGEEQSTIPKQEKQKPTKKSMEKKAPQQIPVKTPQENPQEKRKQRIQSELSTLHQKYKTMNSANLHKTFQEDPKLWHKYHQISEQNEQSFPDDEIPHRRIIQYLETLRERHHSAVVVDLGCGKAKIHQHFQNKFQFHNFDHVAYNDSVISRDISNTELPDASVYIVILCLAMWGSNCESYLDEAYRILEVGGRLLIMEPSKRWIEEETGENRLMEWLQKKRFAINLCEERKFSFFVAIKF